MSKILKMQIQLFFMFTANCKSGKITFIPRFRLPHFAQHIDSGEIDFDCFNARGETAEYTYYTA